MPQWYIHTPAYSAVHSYSSSSPGAIDRISSFGATWLAWKSIEWDIWLVAGFLRWILTLSPTLTRMTGPGTVPPNVQTFWTKPGATVISCSVITRSMSWVSPSMSRGAAAS